MWLLIEGQVDPEFVRTAVGPERTFNEFWYHLETGAVIFLVRDPDAFHREQQDKIRVMTLSGPQASEPLDVTTALTSREWPYVKSVVNSSNFLDLHKEVVEAVSEALRGH